MIKKSYFIQIYPLIQTLSYLFLLAIVTVCLLSLMKIQQTNPFDSLPIIQHFIAFTEYTKRFFMWLTLLLPLTILGCFLPELQYRLEKDSLMNLKISMIGTFQIRRFLKQASAFPVTNNRLKESVPAENTVITRYNHAVKKAVLDITQDRLAFMIPLPKEAQPQKLLLQHEEQIKEHLASLYPEYLVSTFQRQKFKLWIMGTKRK